MKERLIELIYSTEEKFKNVDCTPKEAVVILADYLIENGVIAPPCKVGDKIYKLWYTKCHNGETYPDSWSCQGCYDECDMKKEATEYTVPSLKFIVETFMNGYTQDVYYLTKEEAEQKLKERENI